MSNPTAGTGAKGTTRRRREESSALLPRLNEVETFITCMYCASSISPRGMERVPPRLRSSDSPDARLHCVPVPLTGLAAADVRRACTRSEAHGRAVPTGVRAAGAGTWFSLGSHHSPLPCLPPPPFPRVGLPVGLAWRRRLPGSRFGRIAARVCRGAVRWGCPHPPLFQPAASRGGGGRGSRRLAEAPPAGCTVRCGQRGCGPRRAGRGRPRLVANPRAVPPQFTPRGVRSPHCGANCSDGGGGVLVRGGAWACRPGGTWWE